MNDSMIPLADFDFAMLTVDGQAQWDYWVDINFPGFAKSNVDEVYVAVSVDETGAWLRSPRTKVIVWVSSNRMIPVQKNHKTGEWEEVV